MKTTKSTKALVTLLVIIIIIALAGNYLRNNDGDTNSAAVSRSTSQAGLFSVIRNWFDSDSARDRDSDLTRGCFDTCVQQLIDCSAGAGNSSMEWNYCLNQMDWCIEYCLTRTYVPRMERN